MKSVERESAAPPKPRRTHISTSAKRIKLHETVNDLLGRAGVYKPRGFWYEVDGDWRRWCEGESYGEDSGHIHSVDLRDCNVLLIQSLNKLDDFHAEFGQDKSLTTGYSRYEIDWKRVAESWDGVEIAPYQWKRRHEFSWYYGWDCASGIIWQPRNAIVTYVGPYVREKESVLEVGNAG